MCYLLIISNVFIKFNHYKNIYLKLFFLNSATFNGNCNSTSQKLEDHKLQYVHKQVSLQEAEDFFLTYIQTMY